MAAAVLIHLRSLCMGILSVYTIPILSVTLNWPISLEGGTQTGIISGVEVTLSKAMADSAFATIVIYNILE
jgi:hypothetical protein